MHIGIDGREIQGGVVTGIGRALDVFLRHGLPQGGRFSVFTGKPLRNSYGPSRANIVVPETATILWDQTVLPRLVKEANIDLFYSPYYKIPLFCDRPCVSTIMDLMYLTFGPYRKLTGMGARLYYRTVGTLMAHRSTAIVTCSVHSKSEIVAYYRVNPSKVPVVPLGLDPAFHIIGDRSVVQTTKARLGIAGEYVFYCGNRKPHKNLDALLIAFAQIASARPDLGLVITGSQASEPETVRRILDTHPERRRIIQTGLVALEDQVALYNGAALTVVPSWYEGFGYAVIEAMACGSPVITANRTSLPEIAGDAAVLFDPGAPEELSAAIQEILSSPERARVLRQRGIGRSHEYSAAQYCARLYSVLHDTARKRTSRDMCQ